MPYTNQKAGKGGHMDVVKNPDVAAFLGACDYMRQPSEEEATALAATYQEAPTDNNLPIKVVASDASPYTGIVDNKFPSTKVGYVKVSLVLVDMAEFDGLSKPGSRYVDPYKVAAMHRNADAISFTLPGSNVRYKDSKTVTDGFRIAVYEQYSDDRTNFLKGGRYSIKDTLFAVNNGKVFIDKCPCCGARFDGKQNELFELTTEKPVAPCTSCTETIFVTDFLRLHEQVSDFGDSESALTRFMNATEHLLIAGIIRMLADHQPESLSRMGFIIDGPLALFGQPARIHSRLMGLYYRISEMLKERGLTPPIIIGIQKEGQAMEHARSIVRYLPDNSFRVIDDDYRAKYIKNEVSTDKNFGQETYYGQDFIFKSRQNRIFVVGIPYPFPVKDNSKENSFSAHKIELDRYKNQLGRVFSLIRHFEFDLYDSAIVPVALAHRHASISLVPGGKVLDLVTRTGLNGGIHSK